MERAPFPSILWNTQPPSLPRTSISKITIPRKATREAKQETMNDIIVNGHVPLYIGGRRGCFTLKDNAGQGDGLPEAIYQSMGQSNESLHPRRILQELSTTGVLLGVPDELHEAAITVLGMVMLSEKNTGANGGGEALRHWRENYDGHDHGIVEACIVFLSLHLSNTCTTNFVVIVNTSEGLRNLKSTKQVMEIVMNGYEIAGILPPFHCPEQIFFYHHSRANPYAPSHINDKYGLMLPSPEPVELEYVVYGPSGLTRMEKIVLPHEYAEELGDVHRSGNDLTIYVNNEDRTETVRIVYHDGRKGPYCRGDVLFGLSPSESTTKLLKLLVTQIDSRRNTLQSLDTPSVVAEIVKTVHSKYSRKHNFFVQENCLITRDNKIINTVRVKVASERVAIIQLASVVNRALASLDIQTAERIDVEQSLARELHTLQFYLKPRDIVTGLGFGKLVEDCFPIGREKYCSFVNDPTLRAMQEFADEKVYQIRPSLCSLWFQEFETLTEKSKRLNQCRRDRRNTDKSKKKKRCRAASFGEEEEATPDQRENLGRARPELRVAQSSPPSIVPANTSNDDMEPLDLSTSLFPCPLGLFTSSTLQTDGAREPHSDSLMFSRGASPSIFEDAKQPPILSKPEPQDSTLPRFGLPFEGQQKHSAILANDLFAATACSDDLELATLIHQDRDFDPSLVAIDNAKISYQSTHGDTFQATASPVNPLAAIDFVTEERWKPILEDVIFLDGSCIEHSFIKISQDALDEICRSGFLAPGKHNGEQVHVLICLEMQKKLQMQHQFSVLPAVQKLLLESSTFGCTPGLKRHASALFQAIRERQNEADRSKELKDLESNLQGIGGAALEDGNLLDLWNRQIGFRVEI